MKRPIVAVLLIAGVLLAATGPAAVGADVAERMPVVTLGTWSGWLTKGEVGSVDDLPGWRASVTAGITGDYSIAFWRPDGQTPMYLRDYRRMVTAPLTTPDKPHRLETIVFGTTLWGDGNGTGLWWVDLTEDPGSAVNGIMAGFILISMTTPRTAEPIAPCAEGTAASPDPCVLPPERLSNGDARVVVLATGGGTFEFVVADAPLCRGLVSTIVGDDTDNVIDGTAGDDVISAGDGNDTVRGLGGNDTICLGGGNDTAYGGAGRDVILGGKGADLLFGGGKKDKLIGGGGNDELVGGGGNDVLKGNKGEDTGNGGPGSDKCRVETPTNCER